jgi:hypothetical protein
MGAARDRYTTLGFVLLIQVVEYVCYITAQYYAGRTSFLCIERQYLFNSISSLCGGLSRHTKSGQREAILHQSCTSVIMRMGRLTPYVEIISRRRHASSGKRFCKPAGECFRGGRVDRLAGKSPNFCPHHPLGPLPKAIASTRSQSNT